VFFERGVQRMIYVGPPDIFNFYPAAAVRGTTAPNSIVSLGEVVYYLGEDGYYMFDGNTSQPIGTAKVDAYFFTQLAAANYNSVIGAPGIGSKIIAWAYTSTFSPDGFPDKAMIYRWDNQRWSEAITRVQWIARIPVGRTNIVPPLSAGQQGLGGINSAGYMGFFAGQPMPAHIGTKVSQFNPDWRTFVSRTRPLVDVASTEGDLLTENGLTITTEAASADASGIPLLLEANVANVTIAMSARNNYYDTEVFGPEVAPDISGDCPQRSEGRYHRARISIPSGTWDKCMGVNVEGIRSGTR
jgi:hypothetical protein